MDIWQLLVLDKDTWYYATKLFVLRIDSRWLRIIINYFQSFKWVCIPWNWIEKKNIEKRLLALNKNTRNQISVCQFFE